ncbi:MAG: hypothetical protein L0Z62_48970 [Gemmataceae bacterium]|nr:hypothetical protein [Gemmataceae bacterium]
MAEVEKLIDGPLARALEAGRDRFNAQFAQARHTLRSLDGRAFGDFLREVVGPVVEELAQVAPDRVQAVAEVLYEFALELIGRELPRRFPVLAEGWKTVLGVLPRHLAQSPRRFAGSVTNALHNLALVPGARPAEWIESMRRLGGVCSDTATLLEAGQVAAWRAGLAHYREGALEVCARLDPAVACAALALPDGAPVAQVLGQLRADPWLSPEAAVHDASKARTLRVVARVGDFRGFGGPFLTPPRVAYLEGRFLVGDGEGRWILTADRFGATFHRSAEELPASTGKPRGNFRVDGRGKVTHGKQSVALDELQDSTSQATDGTTLAVTLPLSHRVYLIAAVTEGRPAA